MSLKLTLSDAIIKINSPDVSIVKSGLHDLGTLQEGIEYLRNASLDNNPHIRSAVAAEIARFPYNEAIDVIESLMRDENDYVKQAAMLSIGKLGAHEYIDDVRDIVKFHKNPYVRGIALRVTGSIGGPEDLEILLYSLEDRHPKVRYGSAIGLYMLSDQRALIPIQKNLYTQLDSGEFDAATIKNLIRALESCDSSDRDDYLIIRLLQEAVTARSVAAMVIGRLGINNARAALEKGLTDSSTKLRLSCLHSIVAIGSNESIDSLKNLLDDKDSNIKSKACMVFGDLDDASVIPKINSLAFGGDVNVRISAIKALIKLDNKNSMKNLATLVSDNNPNVRKFVITILAQHADDQLVKNILADALKNEVNGSIKLMIEEIIDPA